MQMNIYVYRYDDDDEQLMVDKTKLMPGHFPSRVGIEVAAELEDSHRRLRSGVPKEV